ncbi:acyl--CoA ligase [Persicimonas caeni]|uniref:Acyl--CoA ligase n=1 Tax=Persicimonas caeni TaxID=2292766 RepID=A0A4Y6PUK4_PERCE|nr:class I adenylate-forming enzyme family protein [Persicimonas caeni]QDG51930.1 acyl--CoA ligase [Persicimonas caeni]QED33151.1 acyl--CoA ligase [Persicimonas caeni]
MHNFPTHFWRKFQDYKDLTALATVDERGKVVEETYWEWTRRVQRLAIALMDAGFEPGTRMGMVAPSGREWIDLAFATWLVGGCLVPIRPDRQRSTTLRALARTGAEWIVVRDADEWEYLRGKNGKLPPHLHWIALEDSADWPEASRFHSLEGLDGHGRSLAVRGRVDDLAEVIYGVDRDQPTLVLFDAKLGDDPHGAFFTGESVGEMLELLGDDLQLRDHDRLATTLEYGVFSSWLLTAATLLQGCQVATASSKGVLRANLNKLLPTRLVCGPAFLDDRANRLRDEIEESTEVLQADGGAAGGLTGLLGRVSKEAARRLFFDPLSRQFGGKLDTVYLIGGSLSDEVTDVIDRTDLTLLGVWGTPECGISHIERPGARRRGSVGRPVQGYACKIDGAKRGEPGEILIRSEVLFEGYWDGDGPRTVDAKGWLHTGTRGRIESGYLYLLPD